MNEDQRPAPVLICCSVLQAEVQSLCSSHWPGLKQLFLPSMLHMHPDRLASALGSVMDAELKGGHQAVLVYGDCCPEMSALESKPGVVRTRCFNCYDLLLGHDEYRRLSGEGVFFLIPEWTRRWEEVFSNGLGINGDNAASLMRELHRKLMYLDTGLAPAPEKELRKCAEYCGLPYEVRQVPLSFLRAAIDEALLRHKDRGSST